VKSLGAGSTSSSTAGSSKQCSARHSGSNDDDWLEHCSPPLAGARLVSRVYRRIGSTKRNKDKNSNSNLTLKKSGMGICNYVQKNIQALDGERTRQVLHLNNHSIDESKLGYRILVDNHCLMEFSIGMQRQSFTIMSTCDVPSAGYRCTDFHDRPTKSTSPLRFPATTSGRASNSSVGLPPRFTHTVG
jgi:hypothetical protein